MTSAGRSITEHGKSLRLARIATPSGARAVRWAQDRWIGVRHHRDPFVTTGEEFDVDSQLLAPVEPRVLVGVMHNSDPEAGGRPMRAFLKSPRTIVEPGGAIEVPRVGAALAGEGEIALVVGDHIHNLTAASARSRILGWTLANDATLTAESGEDGTLLRAKGGAGLTPLGPWVSTGPLPQEIRVRVDGTLVAAGHVAHMARDPYEVVAALSQIMPLGPGDVVMTGAPGTTVTLGVGARIAIEANGMAELASNVRYTFDVDTGNMSH